MRRRPPARLTLRNDEDTEVTVQTRVLRWSQNAGKETLEPTPDVVASPPAVTLAPGADYVVRVVRVSKQPVHGEESYRVIVDQLPRTGRQPEPVGQSSDQAVDSGILSRAGIQFAGGFLVDGL
jgi:P pilus assembly chaperone PapD